MWAFLRDARDQALVQPGAIVVAGDEDAPAVAEVVDIVDMPLAWWSTFVSRRGCSRTTRQSSSTRSYRPDRAPDWEMISQIPPNTATAPIPRMG